jgi:hypothetical protein
MNSEEALQVVIRLIQPNQLKDLQESVFKECWLGKTYQQIADDCGYDHDYIRGIGSQLWQILGDCLQTKVSKNNFRSLIRQFQENFNSQKLEVKNNSNQTPSNQHSQPPDDQVFHNEVFLEIPEGAVPLNSKFYIERFPIEQQCYQEILKPGALISIKAPSLFGKTSLKNRIIAHASKYNYRYVKINFQQADKSLLENINKFLRWFCANIAHQLKLQSNLDDYWDDDFGSKLSCTIYLENYILEQLKNPLVLSLDKADILFEYPQITTNFLPLLRSWYEEAKDADIWQKLRLIVIYSTDIYVPLNINQSPFNVGLSFRLPEFTESQTETLAKLHQLCSENQVNLIQNLRELVGGNPYLLRLAMYNLKSQQISGDKLLRTAPTLSGIYSNHLRSQWIKLQNFSKLLNAMKRIINSEQSLQIEPIIAHKLESMGLVKLEDDKVSPSCELYRIFFRNQLAITENHGNRN